MPDLLTPSGDELRFHQIFEQLVDDLAAKDYAVLDHFFDETETLDLLAVLRAEYAGGDFKKAGIGTSGQFQVDRAIRGDHIRWIDPATTKPPARLFDTRIRRVMGYINRSCFLGLKDVEMHYAVYPPGTFYKRHLDQFKFSDHRKLTFICYLNPDWKPADGGMLRLYLPAAGGDEETRDITPTAGKLVCFRSDLLEHEVLLSNAERYSLTGWMLDQPKGLTFL